MKATVLLIAFCLVWAPFIAFAQVQNPPQWVSSANYAGGGLVRAADGNFYRALRANTGHDGYYSRNNATIRCQFSSSHSNEQGYVADSFGVIDAASAACTDSIEIGYYAQHGGRINATTASVSGTSAGGSDFTPAPNTMDSAGSVIIH